MKNSKRRKSTWLIPLPVGDSYNQSQQINSKQIEPSQDRALLYVSSYMSQLKVSDEPGQTDSV